MGERAVGVLWSWATPCVLEGKGWAQQSLSLGLGLGLTSSCATPCWKAACSPAPAAPSSSARRAQPYERPSCTVPCSSEGACAAARAGGQ